MTRYIFDRSRIALMTTGMRGAARQLGRAVAALAQPAGRPALPPGNDGGGSRRYTFQAVVTIPLAASEDGAPLPGPDWHGVIQAGTGAGRSGGLFTALVSGWEPRDSDPKRNSRAVATIVAFGPDPGNCLPAGEPFVLWRGQEVGRGVVTRRLFV